MVIHGSRSDRLRRATLWVVGALVAFGLGAVWAASRQGATDREQAAREDRLPGVSLTSLQRRLQAEVAARRDLADEVAWLRNAVLELRKSHQRAGDEGGFAAPGDSDDEAHRRGADAARRSAEGPVFD